MTDSHRHDREKLPCVVVYSWLDPEGNPLPCELSLTTSTKTTPPFLLSALPDHGPAWAVSTEIREEPLGLARSLAYDKMLRSNRWRTSLIVFRMVQLEYRLAGYPKTWRVYQLSKERTEDGRGR